ncbi:MAG: SDR family oxidoreductase [Anaerolineales bacterium]|nr:SDR family oxidoreductase [Anaerolineales bacterium]
MSDKPIIIITGASSGIGEASARLFASRGYRLSLAARRFERLKSLADEIQQRGGEALPVTTDVSNLDEIHNLVEVTLDRFGQIDVLVNNAGFGRLNWLEELNPSEDIEAQVKVNVLAVVQMTRAVLPHMIARRSGHVINMASLASFIATPTYSVYAACKFAVRGFTESLRREVGVHGIKVTGIYPGAVNTEFTQHTGSKRKTGIGTPKALRMDAEHVARAVLSAVQRPRRSIILPWYMRFAILANALFPGVVDRIIEARFVKPEREL